MIEPRSAIIRAFDAALEASDPARAVRDQIRVGFDGTVSVAGLKVDSGTPIEAFAIGKAAARMMSGVVEALGERLNRGFVLTKDGHTSDDLPDSITQSAAAHPVLDERSLIATRRLLEWLGQSRIAGPMLCLISGGGSALLELPVHGVSLADFQQVTRLMLNAGADIRQLNAVRSQISRVKGGRLRSLIPNGAVINLIVSDVLGNDVSVIASGPTVPPVAFSLDALSVVSRLGLMQELPQSVKHVIEGMRPQVWQGGSDDQTVVVADNELAITAAGRVLYDAGLLIERSPIPATGEASIRAREFVQWLNTLPSTVTAAIGGGEYTVHVRGDGVGGRNTEFALAAALELDRLAINDWTVASLASDGDDAMTHVAGAIVDGASTGLMRERGHDPEAALANNDSLAPLAAIGATHVTGPTGTNVNDLYLAVGLPKV